MPQTICRLGHHRCLREIAAQELLTATCRALAAVSSKG